mmetsp:Transcript_31494/g.76285  ORF Transcript_31494/g.76285 Transcript_31494/m.76285 type:complete len:1150 (+) Transcript_31494:178-3627(+)
MGLKLKHIIPKKKRKKKDKKKDKDRDVTDGNKSSDDEVDGDANKQSSLEAEEQDGNDGEQNINASGTRVPLNDEVPQPTRPSMAGLRRAKSRRQLREESKRALDAEIMSSSRHSRTCGRPRSLRSIEDFESKDDDDDLGLGGDGQGAVISIPSTSSKGIKLDEDGRGVSRQRSSSRGRPVSMREFGSSSGSISGVRKRSTSRDRSRDRSSERPMSLRSCSFDHGSISDGVPKTRERSLTRSKSIDAAVRRRAERHKKKEKSKTRGSSAGRERQQTDRNERRHSEHGSGDAEEQLSLKPNGDGPPATNRMPLNDADASNAKGDGDIDDEPEILDVRRGRRSRSKDRFDGGSSSKDKKSSRSSKSRTKSRSRSSDRSIGTDRSRNSDSRRPRSRSRTSTSNGTSISSLDLGSLVDHKPRRQRSRSNERRKKHTGTERSGAGANGESMRLLFGATAKTDAETVVAGNKEDQDTTTKTEMTPLAMSLLGVNQKEENKKSSTAETKDEALAKKADDQVENVDAGSDEKAEQKPENLSKEERRARRAKDREARRSTSRDKRVHRKHSGKSEKGAAEKPALSGSGRSHSKDRHSKEASVRRSSRTLNVNEQSDRSASKEGRKVGSVRQSSRTLNPGGHGDRPCSREGRRKSSVRRSSRTLSVDRPPQPPSRTRSDYSTKSIISQSEQESNKSNISQSEHGRNPRKLQSSMSKSHSVADKGLRHSAHGGLTKDQTSLNTKNTTAKDREKPDPRLETQRQVVSVIFHKADPADDEKEKIETPNENTNPLVALLCHGDLHVKEKNQVHEELLGPTTPSTTTEEDNGETTEGSNKEIPHKDSINRVTNAKQFNAEENMALLLNLVGASEKDFEPKTGEDSCKAIALFDTRQQSSVDFFMGKSATPEPFQKKQDEKNLSKKPKSLSDVLLSGENDAAKREEGCLNTTNLPPLSVTSKLNTKSKKKNCHNKQTEAIQEENGTGAKDLFDLIEKSQGEESVAHTKSKKRKSRKIRQSKVDDADAEQSVAPPSLASDRFHNAAMKKLKKKTLMAFSEEGNEEDNDRNIEHPIHLIPAKAKSCTHLALVDDDGSDSFDDCKPPHSDLHVEGKKKKRSSLMKKMKNASISTTKVVGKNSKGVVKKASSTRNMLGQVATKTFGQGKE